MSRYIGIIALTCIGLHAAPAAAQTRLPIDTVNTVQVNAVQLDQADPVAHQRDVIDAADKAEPSRGGFGDIGFATFSTTEPANARRVVTAVRNSGLRPSGETGLFARAVPGRLPEPASWALMLIGFGAVGAMLRRRHLASEAAFTARVRAIAESGDAQGPY